MMKKQPPPRLDSVDENRESQIKNSESTATSVTDPCEEDFSWFGGLGSEIRYIASSLKQTAGGVAKFVHKSAINVANEIAHLEAEELNHRNSEPLHLPWELKNKAGLYYEDPELKIKILELSKSESTFLEPFVEKTEFILDDARVEIIQDLLRKDKALSSMHAKLSCRHNVREPCFWHNYFYACSITRKQHIAELSKALEPLHLEDDVSDHSSNSLVPDEQSRDEQSRADDEESFVNVNYPGSASVRSVGSRRSVRSGKSIGSVVVVDKEDL